MFDSKLVVGYTTQDHLLVDLDNCSRLMAQILCQKIQNDFPELGDCLIVRSSCRHYHLIFDDWCSWERLVYIIELLSDLGIVQKEYATVRTFRRDLTLRISAKHGTDRYRPPPEPVMVSRISHNCNNHQGIDKYARKLRIFNKDMLPLEAYDRNNR